MDQTTDHVAPTPTTTVKVEATATPGLLARLTAVLNPHPVTGFDFAETPGGSVTVTVSVGGNGRGRWHAERAVARLRRVVGVTTVDVVRPNVVRADVVRT